MFILHKEGVEEAVLAFLRAARENHAEVYIVSYTLSPTEKVLDALTAVRNAGGSARIVCKHPRHEDDDVGARLTRRVYESLAKALGSPQCVRGLVGEASEADGEDGPYGRLHAKLFVARTSAGDVQALVGSANLSGPSLTSYTESLYRIPAGPDAENAAEAAVKLWEAACQIDLEDCAVGESAAPDSPLATPQSTGRLEVAVRYEGTPSLVGSTRKWRSEDQNPQEFEPPPGTSRSLRQLIAAVDALLGNWPTPGQDEQLRIFRSLARERHRLNILYLPVGVGKTLIAYRWLLRHVSIARTQGLPTATSLMCLPNEWVEKSVRHDLESRSILDESVVRISRVSHVFEHDFSDFVAVVLDECHNWSPIGAPETSAYARAYEEIRRRKKVKLLGLSATPCRMDQGAFNVRTFASAFMQIQREQFQPRMLLREAVEAGFIVRPRFIPLPLGQTKLDEIQAILGRGRIVWGDYAGTVLRNVWNVLNSDPLLLAKTIFKLAGKHKRRRIVVFVPPVGTGSDLFLEAMVSVFGEGNVHNFLSRETTQAQARLVFDEFRHTAATPGKPLALVTVERFAEGISVPDIDAIVMLRATLSPRVFIQAIGRGLRLCPDAGKTDCLIIDPLGIEEKFNDFEASLTGSETAAPGQETVSEEALDARSLLRWFRKAFHTWALGRHQDRILRKEDLSSSGKKDERYRRILKHWDRSADHAQQLLGHLTIDDLKEVAGRRDPSFVASQHGTKMQLLKFIMSDATAEREPAIPNAPVNVPLRNRRKAGSAMSGAIAAPGPEETPTFAPWPFPIKTEPQG